MTPDPRRFPLSWHTRECSLAAIFDLQCTHTLPHALL